MKNMVIQSVSDCVNEIISKEYFRNDILYPEAYEIIRSYAISFIDKMIEKHKAVLNGYITNVKPYTVIGGAFLKEKCYEIIKQNEWHGLVVKCDVGIINNITSLNIYITSILTEIEKHISKSIIEVSCAVRHI